ncbi:hypothetical protein JRO89_XS01G0172100 [Xanthoceras sorbifolium]|uniref:Uncharacterized protein n=1 Tax=Xanthoceras sorbifolium TaxID=99658 RepID=A0ABQ8IK67_9ROSI|nr:hypothetical protein JRO89_XS01G0172100 [Xanthoceras sorbifolium]
MALKCAVELRIADIIHSHGGPMTLSSIASCIHSTSPPTTDIIPNLKRIMRFLVRREIFTAHDHHSSTGSDDLETLYGLNHLSRLLLYNGDTKNPEYKKLLNDGVANMTKMASKAIVSAERDSMASNHAAFLKSILHDWGDDDCVKILKKCRDAIPKKSGKVIVRG